MKKPTSDRPIVNLRRAYFECRHGQLHVRTAFPSTGGFGERTALLCLHETPRSARTFESLLPEIGTDRSVYACDTPGFGASDPPVDAPSVIDYAASIGDVLDALRLRAVDVLGVGTGAAIAAELAIARPQGIRRLVLADVPIDTAAAHEAWACEPCPVPPSAEGEHLLREWRRSRLVRGPGESVEAFAAGFVDELGHGAAAGWGAAATHRWQGAERLGLVTQKTLLLRGADGAASTARSLLRDGTLETLANLGPGLTGAQPGAVAARLRSFLD